MAINTDLQSVIDRIIADYELATGEQANANQVIEALIGAYGGAAHAIYRYIDNRLEQIFPSLANEQYLALWGNIAGITQEQDESLDDFRIRVEIALKDRSRFGTIDDLIAWAIVYSDIDFAYSYSTTPGYSTIALGSYGVLSEARKQEIKLAIEEKMAAGSVLLITQSQPQFIDFTITADGNYQTDIRITLDDLIKSTNINHNASLTIAQINDQIANITIDYTLISPVATITATGDNYLRLGEITWQ
jgi:uncharacterized phage protein gp47/JayE